jgi:hypothetical protein
MCFLTFCYDLKVYPPNFEGLSSLILIDAACRKRNAAYSSKEGKSFVCALFYKA